MNTSSNKPRKLSFKEKQELQHLEEKIAELENEKSELENKLASGTLKPDELMKVSTRHGQLLTEIDLYETRWIGLSELI